MGSDASWVIKRIETNGWFQMKMVGEMQIYIAYHVCYRSQKQGRSRILCVKRSLLEFRTFPRIRLARIHPKRISVDMHRVWFYQSYIFNKVHNVTRALKPILPCSIPERHILKYKLESPYDAETTPIQHGCIKGTISNNGGQQRIGDFSRIAMRMRLHVENLNIFSQTSSDIGWCHMVNSSR